LVFDSGDAVMNQQGFCEQCGANLEAGSKFCQECGTPVSQGEETATPLLHSLHPHQRTTPHTLQSVLEQKTRLPSLWMVIGTIVSCSSMVCGLLTLVLGPGLTSSETAVQSTTIVIFPSVAASQSAIVLTAIPEAIVTPTIPTAIAPVTQNPAALPPPEEASAVPAAPTEPAEAVEQAGARDLTGFNDDFSSNINSWQVPSEDNGTVTVSNGKLNLAVTKTEKYLPVKIPWYITTPVNDVTLSMTAVVQNPGQGAFGLICRAADLHNFYMVSIAPNATGGGKFSLIKDKNSNISYLVEEEYTSELNGGEIPEKVVFSCKGDTLRLELNGKLIKEVNDSDIKGGDTYIFALSLDDVSESDPYRVSIDDFKAAMP
jgi:hypothetical protein